MKLKLFGREIIIRAQRTTGGMTQSAWASFLAGNGHTVTPETALKVGAVFRCVDLVSKTMASMPLHLYRETEDGKEKAKDHRIYNLLLRQPNRYTTAFEFWQIFFVNLLLTRGGYAKIQRNAHGYVTELWNIPTQYVQKHGINSVNGEPYVIVTDRLGQSETLHPGEFLFVPNFRWNDRKEPDDPLGIAADVIGLSQQVEQFAESAFRNGVNPGGFIEIPSQLSENAYRRLQESFEKNYAGVQNAGKFIMLEEGTKADFIERDLEKTQALESRKFAVTEICRIFGVPPHMCMDLEHATFSNIEHQSLEFVRDGINPLSVRVEQALYRDVLSETEKRNYFFKFNTNSLMRGDTAARTSYYNAMRQNGIMNADEIRELEDMNRIPDGQGATYYINGNMLPLENAKLNAPKSARGGENK